LEDLFILIFKNQNGTKPLKSIMKFDGFPREKTNLSFKLTNGVGWLTTHRLIIQKETLNPRFNIMERQDPEMYLLRDFDKAEISLLTLPATSILSH
jgi:hypothetical protein